MGRQIYVNLPIKNLKRSVVFFTALGFTFEPKFTNEVATGMIVSNDIHVMLLEEAFFKTFLIDKTISDATKTSEVLLALTCESRKEVDDLVSKAIAAGGKETRKPQDHGFMFIRAFDDLDGHTWELFHMSGTPG